MKYKRKL